MTLKIRGPRRFSSPGVLQGDAPFLGATVQQWDDTLTGNMEKSLADIKRRTASAPKRDVSEAVTSDLASFVGNQLASAK